MKPVNEQDNHDKGNKGVFESKGKRVEGAGKNCAGRRSHSSRDLVVAEPSEEALEGCHKPTGGGATRRPRPPAAPRALGRTAGAGLCLPRSLQPLRPPGAVPSLTPNNLLASRGLYFVEVTASGTPGSRLGPSWVPHLTPPPAPAPYPLRDWGQRQPASRGRRAAPNRPAEPRENPGGSREIQPR